jgi:serine/threonine protein kinase
VHRDIKPSNLFLTEQNGQRIVKVLDFGISKNTAETQQSVTMTGAAFGTPQYMSPEQVHSTKHVDARADVWALGVVLYELLAGKPPFCHTSATAIIAAILMQKPQRVDEHRREVPSGLAKAIMRALEKEPDSRFPDVQAFAAAIAPYGPPRDDPTLVAAFAELSLPGSRAGGPVAANTAYLGVHSGSARGRGKRVVLAVVALAAALSIAAIFAVVTTGGSPKDTAPGTAAVQTSTGVSPPLPATNDIRQPPPGDTAPQPTVAPAQPTARPTAQPASSGSRQKPAATAQTTAPRPTTAPSQPPPDPKYL